MTDAAYPRGHGGARDDGGASGVEYGLLISGVAALLVAVLFLFGANVGGLFTDTCRALDTARSAATSC